MKLKPYPEYKDSGVEALGEIPAHWKMLRIKNVLSEVDRRSSTGNESLLSMTRKRGLIRYGDISDKPSSASTLVGYKVCEPGELVMNRMQAWSGMFHVAHERGLISPDYAVFVPVGYANTNYLGHLLRSPVMVSQFAAESKGIGSGFLRLYTDRFGAIPIPLPSPKEQVTAIGYIKSIYSLIDRFIRNKRRLIKLLQEQKQAVINDCVTGKMEVRRIVDENGNSSFRLQPSSCKMRDSGIDWLGEIPEHWEVRRFKNVCRLQRGHDLSNDRFVEGEYPVYGSNGIIGYHNSFTAKAPCITVGRSGSVGEVNYIERDFWAHNTTLYAIDNCSNNWRYLFYVLKNTDLKMVSGGSAVPTLNRNYIHKLHVAIPSLEDQYQIASSLDETIRTVEHSISGIESQIDLIQEYRTRLIADVVTGKVDVRGIRVEDVPEDEALEELVDEMDEGLPDEDEYEEEA